MLLRIRKFFQHQLQRRGIYITRRQARDLNGIGLEHDLGIVLRSLDPMCFDVGANKGQTIELLQKAFPRPRIYAFEPSSDSFETLSHRVFGKNIKLFNCAVGATNANVEFRNYDWSTLSSLLELRDTEGNPFRGIASKLTEFVTMKTIDTLMEQEGVSTLDLLKSDTQGYDLPVLKGASLSLKAGRIRNVLVELTFAPLYQGQSDPLEVMEFLQQHDFSLVDFYEKVFHGNRLAWCTALFSRA